MNNDEPIALSYLAPGLPVPVPSELDAPYWQALRDNRLSLQRCKACSRFQWGPEWLCHRCHSFELEYQDVAPQGKIYSFERVWHPVHPALKEQGAYLVVLVELSHADDVRLVGNLLGEAEQEVVIGAAVRAVFEHHAGVEANGNKPYTLLQWEVERG